MKQRLDEKRLQTLAGLNENHGMVFLSGPGMQSFATKDHMAGEDIEISHTDDEPGMIADELYTLIKAAQELLVHFQQAEESGYEVDYPHWLQAKIVLAKEHITKANNHLQAQMGRGKANFFSHQ